MRVISSPKTVRHRSVTGSYGNSESTDKTFLLVEISITIRDNKPFNYIFFFDLVDKSFFLAWFTWFTASIPFLFKWNALLAITQNCKYSRSPEEPIERDRHPFLKQGKNPKGVPFWSKKVAKRNFETFLESIFSIALLTSKFNLGLGSDIHLDGYVWSLWTSTIITKNLPNLWTAIVEDKRYENSFLCADKIEIIFTAFGVCKDDLDMCPPKFCHKCFKLL